MGNLRSIKRKLNRYNAAFATKLKETKDKFAQELLKEVEKIKNEQCDKT